MGGGRGGAFAAVLGRRLDGGGAPSDAGMAGTRALRSLRLAVAHREHACQLVLPLPDMWPAVRSLGQRSRRPIPLWAQLHPLHALVHATRVGPHAGASSTFPFLHWHSSVMQEVAYGNTDTKGIDLRRIRERPASSSHGRTQLELDGRWDHTAVRL